jgi:hypothetical protein
MYEITNCVYNQYFEHVVLHVNSFFRDSVTRDSPNVIKVTDSIWLHNIYSDY